MARADFNYAQTYIGACGHLVAGWPAITKVGGADPVVPCDDCWREKLEIPGNDGLGVWVRIKDSTPVGQAKAKPVRKKPVAKKPKPPAPWEVFLFDVETER